jgi:hypothetical protein
MNATAASNRIRRLSKNVMTTIYAIRQRTTVDVRILVETVFVSGGDHRCEEISI